MGAPPPKKARAGRANPAGIPHLYVASDQPTAVAEVRAEPGDWVTVASVTIGAAPMRVLDLTRDVRIVDPHAHKDLHEALVLRELLHVFAYELGRPVRPGDTELDYVATQFIAEYFRDKRVGGIIFPSALADERNAVFFDPNVATIGQCVEATVWSKSVDVVDTNEFERRDRKRRGYGF
jgi:RES domain-containing protein